MRGSNKRKFSLVLEIQEGNASEAPAAVRLRRALKALLRSHGIRCCSAIELDVNGRPVGLPTAEQPTVEVETGADTTCPR